MSHPLDMEMTPEQIEARLRQLFEEDRWADLRISPMRFVVHLAMVWHWPARRRCHRSILCCQYVDRPNCNNAAAPWGWHHR